MKVIQNKTEKMLKIENNFNLPIEEILRQKFVDENKTITQIGKELNITYVTVIKWLSLAGIYSRRLKLEEKGL